MMISLNNMATQETTTRWLKVEYRFKYWDSIERKNRFHTTFTIRIEHKELPPAEQMVKEVKTGLHLSTAVTLASIVITSFCVSLR